MTNDNDVYLSIVAGAVDLIAESGTSAVSLAATADRAGVPEPAVAEVFSDVPTLIAATMGWMFGDLALYVGSRVEAEPVGLPRIHAYIRSLNRYFFETPKHVRVMGAVLGGGELAGVPGERTRERRWQALADLLSEGQNHGRLGAFDTRAVAIVIGGAVDGLIAEWVADPDFDLLGATEELVRLVEPLTGGAAFAG